MLAPGGWGPEVFTESTGIQAYYVLRAFHGCRNSGRCERIAMLEQHSELRATSRPVLQEVDPRHHVVPNRELPVAQALLCEDTRV